MFEIKANEHDIGKRTAAASGLFAIAYYLICFARFFRKEVSRGCVLNMQAAPPQVAPEKWKRLGSLFFFWLFAF
jgi:hypothetical protein